MAIEPIARGAKVRQIVQVVRGEVTERRWNDSHSVLEYRVVQADGGERWFLSTEIEIDPEAVENASEPPAPDQPAVATEGSAQ